MKACTVHEREDAEGGVAERAERILFVKEGFAWWALLFPLLWLLFHRMWLVLIGFIVVMVALQMGLTTAGMPSSAGTWLVLGVSLLFAVVANDLRRWTLARNGYREIGPLTGRSRAECEAKFFTAWLAARPDGTQTSPQSAGQTRKTGQGQSESRRDAGESDEIIGLFPQPDR